MKLIKRHKKIFIGVVIIAALLAIIPTAWIYVISNLSIGITEADSVEEVEKKVDAYFEGNGLTEDIISWMRKKPTGDFNIYAINPNSEDFIEIEKNMDIIVPQAMELNRLEKGKNYNIKIYSDFYEGEKKVSTEKLLSKDIVGSEDFHIIYGDHFMDGGSKRDMALHFIQENKVLETLSYYIPTNYNESAIVNDADFNINEDIPIMSFTRGIKVDGKYKTYSPDMHKSKDKMEKSIKMNLSKNEKMVILRLELNKI
ncbi:hypothetical protein [Romboutsia sp.]|uniref:hypothetical protein n=1 Tax=Romboutsia sp. TaxID=1965302 RepID=UPI003F395B41